MELGQVSDRCFKLLHETNRVCDANFSLIHTHEDTDHAKSHSTLR